MRPIRVVAVGAIEKKLLPPIATALARELSTTAKLADERVDAAFAHHPERNQYHSTAIIDYLLSHANYNGEETIVGVTDLDLYIPILTFVFGEAQLGGTCAIVSHHRLAQEFYGLPPDKHLFLERLIKEAVHETGHTAGLTHCDDYECVMAASYSVEWLDLKGRGLCEGCMGLMGQMGPMGRMGRLP